MSNQYVIRKDEYSEQVVRRAIYWFSRYCEWELIEEADCWCIKVENDRQETNYRAVLDRLVNEEKIREEIEQRTYGLRNAIIQKVLKDLGA